MCLVFPPVVLTVKCLTMANKNFILIISVTIVSIGSSLDRSTVHSRFYSPHLFPTWLDNSFLQHLAYASCALEQHSSLHLPAILGGWLWIAE